MLGPKGQAVPRPHRGRAAVTIPNLCREGTSEIPGVGGERSALHSSSRSGEQAKHLPAACSCSQICYDLSLRQEGMSVSLESKRGCGAAGAGGRCCWTCGLLEGVVQDGLCWMHPGAHQRDGARVGCACTTWLTSSSPKTSPFSSFFQWKGPHDRCSVHRAHRLHQIPNKATTAGRGVRSISPQPPPL